MTYYAHRRLDDEIGEKFLDLLDDNNALVELDLSQVEIGMEHWTKIEERISERR